MTAISSAGSLENIKLLRDNQAQFAILQGPFGAWSWDGEGPVIHSVASAQHQCTGKR